MRWYYALIIDVKKSRSYPKEYRIEIQNHIKKSISELNEIFKKTLQFEVVFSSGDEFQGLFKSACAAFLYYRLLKMLIAPVQIRGGIGKGGWDIQIKGGASTEQDGTAYHNARRTINDTSGKTGYGILIFSGNRKDAFINAEMNTLVCLLEAQTEYQNELTLLTELMYPIMYQDEYEVRMLERIKPLILKRDAFAFLSAAKKTKKQTADFGIYQWRGTAKCGLCKQAGRRAILYFGGVCDGAVVSIGRSNRHEQAEHRQLDKIREYISDTEFDDCRFAADVG